ncbi:hypothetical protein, partial [Actinotignum timonense]
SCFTVVILVYLLGGFHPHTQTIRHSPLVANPNALRPDMQAPTVFEKSTPLGHNFFKIETACP